MYKKAALLVALLCGCSGPSSFSYSVEVLQPIEVIEQEEPNVEALLVVVNHESHITFRCEGWYNQDGPLNPDAPDGVLVEVCVAGQCHKNLLGTSAEVIFWSRDFGALKNTQSAYCIVYMPEWYTMTGFPPNTEIDELYPERRILGIRVPIKVITEPKETKRYCNSVVYDHSGYKCVSWY